jgi:hypothetical protein
MYENRGHELIKPLAFMNRVSRHVALAVTLVAASLFIGVLGYRDLEGMTWIDATLNASMILGGMGPVTELKTDAGKLFASAFALYSGMLFLATAAIVFAPMVHRLLHRFHMD